MLLKAHKVAQYESIIAMSIITMSIIAIKMRIIVKPITFDTSAPRYLPIEYKKARSLPYAPTREFGACAGTVGGAFTQAGTGQAEVHAGRRAIEKAAPVYPELARRAHIRGMVKLEVVVRPNGSVKSTRTLGGSPALIEAATDAVRKWKFEAAQEETTEIVQLMFEPQ
jgi:protein TonB